MTPHDFSIDGPAGNYVAVGFLPDRSSAAPHA
jgi:hypothetical protein